MKRPRKLNSVLRSTKGREKTDDPGPWQVDPVAEVLAHWLADKPLRISIMEIDGQRRDVSSKRHPTAAELRWSLRYAAIAAREAYLKEAEVPVGPALTTLGDRDWNEIYRRPDVPMAEYQKRVKKARLAMQGLLECNFKHMPDPPYLLEWEIPNDKEEHEEHWRQYNKELHCYHADVFESLEKAYGEIREIENGLAKSAGRRGAKRDWQLYAGSLAVWAGTLTIAGSAYPQNKLPKQTMRDIRRAVWRDAGLPIKVNARKGSDEDAWIDKQLESFE